MKPAAGPLIVRLVMGILGESGADLGRDCCGSSNARVGSGTGSQQVAKAAPSVADTLTKKASPTSDSATNIATGSQPASSTTVTQTKTASQPHRLPVHREMST
jgi:hypothetical protein